MSSCKFMLSRGNPLAMIMQQKPSATLCNNNKIELGQLMKDFATHEQQTFCGLPATNGVCIIHKCCIPECFEHVKSNDYYLSDDKDQSTYCMKHTCHSGSICWKVCLNGNYCYEHKCLVCDNEAIGETKLCKVHLTAIRCAVKDCMNYVKVKFTEDTIISPYQYCSEHACHKCQIQEKMDGFDLCYDCKCVCETCRNVRDTKTRYCVEHAKLICHYKHYKHYQHCSHLQYANSSFCKEHKCIYQGCVNHIYAYNDEDGGYQSVYCYHHDSLDKLCKKYFITLEDVGIRKMIESDRTRYEILRELPQTPTYAELMEHIRFNIAIMAEKR